MSDCLENSEPLHRLLFITDEPVSKRSILFEVKKGENFNHRNMLDISRIKIVVCRRDRAKGGVLKLAQMKEDVFRGGG
jgi:hypothetical protein